ncbi:MAG: hypothetical protein ACT4UQ_00550 [Gammaproteobacteria bacterium]
MPHISGHRSVSERLVAAPSAESVIVAAGSRGSCLDWQRGLLDNDPRLTGR